MPMTSATELHRPRVRADVRSVDAELMSWAKTSITDPFAICSPPLARCSRHASRDTIPHDGALDAALERIGGRDVDRPDTPDLHVTAGPPAAGGRRAAARRFRDALDPRLNAALVVARRRAALHAPGRGDRARAGRPARRRHHADARRARRSATTRRCSTRSCRIRRAARCICFRPRRSRRISSPSCRRCARRSTAGRGEQIGVFTYDGDTPQDARRTIRVARAPRAQQPGHGALGHPAAPSALGEAVREPALRDHRRAARLSRRVRQPPVQRPAAAAPDLPALRIESGVPLLVGDDCQPARAGRAAHRAAVRAGGQSGAPRGEKFFVFVNPPVVNHQLGIRRSYLGETRRVASEFLKRNLQLDRLRAEPARRPRS